MSHRIWKHILLSITLAASTAVLNAQTTLFTYQGSLKDGANPANGTYDIEIDVFDAAAGGNYFNTITISNVPVVNGTFSVKLDLGANIFPGDPRFLQIKVKQSGSAPWIVLNPRQEVTSSPYAVRSLSAATATTAADALQLGGVEASQFVQTNDPRMSDARAPLAGSPNYVQNTSSTREGNFNITGTGSANILNASQFNLNGSKILSNGGISDNLYLGMASGQSSTGSYNAFFGTRSGERNLSGEYNSFFGFAAGGDNRQGSNNSFFGHSAGFGNQSGVGNSAFGYYSLITNWNGSENSTFGYLAGRWAAGSGNTFIGARTGASGLRGSNNTALGTSADVSADAINATALGNRAMATQNNSLILGSINGVNGAAADTDVGIGTTTPSARLHVHNGSVKVTAGGIYIANPNTLIITSPNGACWGITVNNSGGLATFPVSPCP